MTFASTSSAGSNSWRDRISRREFTGASRRIRLGTILVLLLLVHPRPPRAVRRTARAAPPGSSSRISSTTRTSSARAASGRNRSGSAKHDHGAQRAGDARRSRRRRFSRVPSGLRAHGPAPADVAVRAPGRSRFSRRSSTRRCRSARRRRSSTTIGCGQSCETKRPAVSSLVHDPAAGQYFVSIGVPVSSAASRFATCSACAFSHRCSAPSSASGTAAVDGVVAVIDSRMTIVARTRAEEKLRRRQPERRLRQSDLRARAEGAALDAPRGNPVVLGVEPFAADGLDHRHRAARRRRSTSRPCSRCSCSLPSGCSPRAQGC